VIPGWERQTDRERDTRIVDFCATSGKRHEWRIANIGLARRPFSAKQSPNNQPQLPVIAVTGSSVHQELAITRTRRRG
jgi:hypothetical protein